MAKTTLTIVVNGTETDIERNDNAPLGSVIGKALAQTGNTGQPPDRWELKDKDGNLLDPNKKIGEFGFPAVVVLFLTLQAGVAGAQ